MANQNAINVTFPISVANGGTGAATLTNHGVLIGAGTSAISGITAGTDGQLLTGVTSSAPAFASSLVGDFTFTSATSGATRTLTVNNTDNTSTSSMALLKISTAGSTAGDAYITATTTTTPWSYGVDNSVISPTADPFVISQSTTLGTNNVMSVDTAGAINYPLQPAFQANHSVSQTNLTGNNTLATINYSTEIFDQANNYDATNTFTAPVTGVYCFSCSILTSLTTTATKTEIQLTTSARNYIFIHLNGNTTRTNTGSSDPVMTVLANMTAGDTAIVQWRANGVGSDTLGAANNANFSNFTGYLVA